MLRNIKALIYLGLLGLLALFAWKKIHVSLLILASENSFFPAAKDHFYWTAVGLFIACAAAVVLLDLLRLFNAGKGHYLAIMAGFALVVVISVNFALSATAAGPGVHPDARVLEFMGGFGRAVDDFFLRKGRYPDSISELAVEPPPDGYLHHGLRSSISVKVIGSAGEPKVEEVREERAGTVCFWVDNEKQDYWIAGFGLNGGQQGAAGPLKNAAGRIIVITSPKRMLETLPRMNEEEEE